MIRSNILEKQIIFLLQFFLIFLIIACDSKNPNKTEILNKKRIETVNKSFTNIHGEFQNHKISFDSFHAELTKNKKAVILTFKGVKIIDEKNKIPIEFQMLIREGLELNKPIQLPHYDVGFFAKKASDPFRSNILLSEILLTSYPKDDNKTISGNLDIKMDFCNEEGNVGDQCGWMKGDFSAKVEEFQD